MKLQKEEILQEFGGLVHALFVAQTTWFGIPDFCNVKGEWVRHGVEDQEVRDGNGV